MVKLKNPKRGVDRISSLPESLISQILSLLPVKNAVATSILSRRWKLFWTSITTLNFDEDISISSLPHEEIDMKRAKFTLFVNRVLLLITPPRVQNFRLHCTKYLLDPSYLNSWITDIAPTARELDFDLYDSMEIPMVLPLSDSYWNKLVVLKLKGFIGNTFSIHFKIPAQVGSVCFPSLHTLHLAAIKFDITSNSSVSFPNLKIMRMFYVVESANEDSVTKLLSSCPVLDDLDISTHDWKKTLSLIFRIPSLTRLTLNFWGRYDPPDEIQIDKLHKLKFLSIQGYAPQAIVTASVNISLDFHNLKMLESKARYLNEFRIVITNLLGTMGNLEHLVLTRTYNCPCSQNQNFTEPLNVPKCLLSRVTTIFFTQMMDDCNEELEMVRYLLRNAKVLQVFKLSTGFNNSHRKHGLIKKISMFPRGSQACQVEFI